MVFPLPTVPGDVPQPPEVNTSDINTTTALVGWLPPPDPNGIILNYTVRYVAVSMAAAGEGRRRRQAGSVILPECILGGQGNINRTQRVAGTETSLLLTNLSQCIYHYMCDNTLSCDCLLQLHF